MAFSLNDYTILDEIGHGGFATVYKARQKSINKVVALKRLTPLHQQSKEQIIRFRREAEAMASLTHDNILTVIDYAFCSGAYYIVMEYIDGINFNSALEQNISQLPALYVIEKAAGAIDTAHSRGIIHRDIKPANILLGCNGQVKLADFGLARISDGATSVTSAGTVMGTFSFLAPEALISPDDIDSKVDIFSLGCMLYRILSGKLPFEGSSLAAVSQKILNDEPPDIESDSPLVKIAMKMLDKERDRRPDAKEVLTHLRLAIGDNYHSSSSRFLDFMGNRKIGTIENSKPESSCKISAGKQTSFAIGKFIFTAIAAAVILIGAAIVYLQIKSREPALPNVPDGVYLPNEQTFDARHADKKNIKKIAGSPVPVGSADITPGTNSLILENLSFSDTIIIDQHTILPGASGRRTVELAPGHHRLEIRQKNGEVIRRDMELLPYERKTIDLQHEGNGNAEYRQPKQ